MMQLGGCLGSLHVAGEPGYRSHVGKMHARIERLVTTCFRLRVRVPMQVVATPLHAVCKE